MKQQVELKTLKDIRIEGPYNKTENSLMNRCIRDTYREEAKNWLKHTETMPPISKDVLSKFIKHFFNISEEDLK